MAAKARDRLLSDSERPVVRVWLAAPGRKAPSASCTNGLGAPPCLRRHALPRLRQLGRLADTLRAMRADLKKVDSVVLGGENAGEHLLMQPPQSGQPTSAGQPASRRCNRSNGSLNQGDTAG